MLRGHQEPLDTILPKSVFDNVGFMGGLEKEIAMETQNRLWGWGCDAPVGEMPEKSTLTWQTCTYY